MTESTEETVEEERQLVNAMEGESLLELKKTSAEVTLPLTLEDKELIVDLLKYTIEEDGRGMAAIQLGEAKRIFVFEKPAGSGRLQVVVNPVVHQMQGARRRVEGCFSFPGLSVLVQRPADIIVSYHDETGALIENEDLSGNTGQTFLHEFSHLEGITMLDASRYGKPVGRV